MDDFKRAIAIARRRYQRKDIIPNLMPDKEAMLKRLKKHKFLKIISADKNCGFVLIKTDHLTERGVNEHLKNAEVYCRLSKGVALAYLKGVEQLIENFISKYSECMSEAESTFLRRGLKNIAVRFLVSTKHQNSTRTPTNSDP